MSKYALSVLADNRIHHACVVLPTGDYSGMSIVNVLPDGDVSDYLFVDGKYVYDPVPNVEPERNPLAPRNVTEGEYISVNGVLYKALSSIPNGEPIITGQNAIETTFEEQLAKLAEGE